MDRRKHLDACLQAHRDLLELQKEVHHWIDGLVGWDEGSWRAQRPARPARAGTRPAWDHAEERPWRASARPWETERDGAPRPARGRWERPPGH